MPINVHVPKPEKIHDPKTLRDVLDRMQVFKQEYATPSDKIGVLLLQNHQLGANYRIATETYAEEAIHKPRRGEWGVKFYSEQFFVDRYKQFGGIYP